jgi:hypothetical protein
LAKQEQLAGIAMLDKLVPAGLMITVNNLRGR